MFLWLLLMTAVTVILARVGVAVWRGERAQREPSPGRSVRGRPGSPPDRSAAAAPENDESADSSREASAESSRPPK